MVIFVILQHFKHLDSFVIGQYPPVNTVRHCGLKLNRIKAPIVFYPTGVLIEVAQNVPDISIRDPRYGGFIFEPPIKARAAHKVEYGLHYVALV